MDQIISPQQAERYCLDIANNHYENFPVVSVLIPKTLRVPVAAVYAFARIADGAFLSFRSGLAGDSFREARR